MIYSIEKLKEIYKDYANVYEKIDTEVKNNRLYKVKRGIYSDSLNSDIFFIANILCTPSYISFETALAYYGLIPERVYAIKSATYSRRKKKEFKNIFGLFMYQDITKEAYPYEIRFEPINDELVLIASKEKALLDTLYTIKNIRNINEIPTLLFEDLRINEEGYDSLNKERMIEMCDLYKSNTLKTFKKYLLREVQND